MTFQFEFTQNFLYEEPKIEKIFPGKYLCEIDEKTKCKRKFALFSYLK